MIVHVHNEPEPSKRQSPWVIDGVIRVVGDVDDGTLQLVLKDGGTMRITDWTRFQVWRFPRGK